MLGSLSRIRQTPLHRALEPSQSYFDFVSKAMPRDRNLSKWKANIYKKSSCTYQERQHNDRREVIFNVALRTARGFRHAGWKLSSPVVQQ